MVQFSPISTPEHRTSWMFWWAIHYIWTVEILRFRQFFPILPISSICGHETNKLLWKGGSFDTTAIPEGGSAVGRTIWCSSRGEGHAPLLYSNATDPGNGISPSPGSCHGDERRCLGVPVSGLTNLCSTMDSLFEYMYVSARADTRVCVCVRARVCQVSRAFNNSKKIIKMRN